MVEGFLAYHNSFVASTSDFWHHPVWKKAFVAVVANFMGNGYHFRKLGFLAVSKTTMQRLQASGESKDLLGSTVPTLHRIQALLDFSYFDDVKTGENIGQHLEDVHDGVGCKPDYIGSHVVDGAGNAGKSVDCLQWQTSGERSQKIVADPCDAHSANTSSNMASGTSAHVTNLNPDMGAALLLLHNWMTKIVNYKACQTVVANVRSEHLREKFPTVRYKQQTRWGSEYKEAECAAANQFDLEVALNRMASPGGVDEKIRDENTSPSPVLSEDQWEKILQYEAGMEPMNEYITFVQSAKVIAHEELFMARSTIEQLDSMFFLMKENISRKTGTRGAKDLTVSSPLLFGLCNFC